METYFNTNHHHHLKPEQVVLLPEPNQKLRIISQLSLFGPFTHHGPPPPVDFVALGAASPDFLKGSRVESEAGWLERPVGSRLWWAN